MEEATPQPNATAVPAGRLDPHDTIAEISRIIESHAESAARAQIWKLVLTLNAPWLFFEGLAAGVSAGIWNTIYGSAIFLFGAGFLIGSFKFWRLEISLKRSRAGWTQERAAKLAQLKAAAK